jgi:hypothetical protein
MVLVSWNCVGDSLGKLLNSEWILCQLVVVGAGPCNCANVMPSNDFTCSSSPPSAPLPEQYATLPRLQRRSGCWALLESHAANPRSASCQE